MSPSEIQLSHLRQLQIKERQDRIKILTILNSFIRNLQQNPLLRVDRVRLGLGHTEKLVTFTQHPAQPATLNELTFASKAATSSSIK
jgi:hypothetical protein